MSVEEYRQLDKRKGNKGSKQFKTMHAATKQHMLDSRSRESPAQGRVMALAVKYLHRALQRWAMRYKSLTGGSELVEAEALVRRALKKIDKIAKGES